MNTIKVRTKKIGGSIMVRIPKDVVEEESIKPNQTIKITIEKEKNSGFGILKGRKIIKEHVRGSDFD